MKHVTLQESDMQAIAAIMDEKLAGAEQTIISRLEDAEEFFNTRLDEGEARADIIGLYKELEQIESRLKSVEARLDRLCHCSGTAKA